MAEIVKVVVSINGREESVALTGESGSNGFDLSKEPCAVGWGVCCRIFIVDKIGQSLQFGLKRLGALSPDEVPKVSHV